MVNRKDHCNVRVLKNSGSVLDLTMGASLMAMMGFCGQRVRVSTYFVDTRKLIEGHIKERYGEFNVEMWDGYKRARDGRVYNVFSDSGQMRYKVRTNRRGTKVLSSWCW